MLIKKLKLRIYQEELLDKANKKNSLIVLPTGLGKTFIALALSLLYHDRGTVVFTAPTRPLVEQHKKLFDEYTKLGSIIATGLTPPSKREELYKKTDVIFCTPQTLENDILTGRFNLKKTSLIIFDEAHRALGNYAYVFIAKQYARIKPEGRILAMTASPGKDEEGIERICNNLNVHSIAFKNAENDSVKPYVKNKKIKAITVELPEGMKEIKKDLERVKAITLHELKKKNLVRNEKTITKKQLLDLQKELWAIASTGQEPGVYSDIKKASEAFKTIHALELIETKGPESLRNYMKKLRAEKNRVKSSSELFKNVYFVNAYEKTLECNEEHPKIKELVRIIKNQDLKKSRIIVFSKLRDVSKNIAKKLNKIKDVKAAEFIGQKEGITQKKQLATLEKFKNGELNVLVATQVIHEGIHVSNADVGIFFEPLPSAIQTIQRKGRIGRTNIGKIFVLMTKGCVDEKHYWAGKWNEKKTRRILEEISSKGNQKTIIEF